MGEMNGKYGLCALIKIEAAGGKRIGDASGLGIVNCQTMDVTAQVPAESGACGEAKTWLTRGMPGFDAALHQGTGIHRLLVEERGCLVSPCKPASFGQT